MNCFVFPFCRQNKSIYPNSTSVTVSVNESNTNLGFSNAKGIQYTATIYVEGQPFQVTIDTGSSDLWINSENATFTGLVDTGYNTTISYVDESSASGPITLGDVSLGEFTVKGQVFINAPGNNASRAGLEAGLLGVGP
ncbi:hypothetical protein B0H21DRAFT_882366 [Amylocystis lapponica]|nr:hypothetical protein B0H21DRAFT_882366 [Amylocystis lapponica]